LEGESLKKIWDLYANIVQRAVAGLCRYSMVDGRNGVDRMMRRSPNSRLRFQASVEDPVAPGSKIEIAGR